MIWEYLLLAVILAWAVYFLWRTFFKKKGCSCTSCPLSKEDGCASPGLGDLRQLTEDGRRITEDGGRKTDNGRQ